MAIRVTISKTLEDFWGADEAYAHGGECGLIELVCEDLYEFINNAEWTVKKERAKRKEAASAG